MKNKISLIKEKIFECFKNNKMFIVLMLFAIVVTAPLAVNGFFKTHDGYSHLARIYSMVEGLKEGQFPAEITHNFCLGYGYSWNIFYPPLLSILGAICYFFIRNYVISIKIVLFLITIGAAITMYQLIKDITKNKKTAVITSAIYISSVYFLTDLYLRCAMGEIAAFVFLPVLFRGMYSLLYGDMKKHYLITIGAIGIILAHNISAFYTTILCVIYLLLNIKKIYGKNCKTEKILKKIVINACFIITISMFFYLPLIQNMKNTNYKCTDSMTSINMVEKNAIYPYQLIFSKPQWNLSRLNIYNEDVTNDMSFQLGIAILVPVMLTPLVYGKIDKEKRYLYNISLIFGIFTAFMATVYFPWSKLPGVFLMIQFSWRMLLYSTFLLSIIAGINIQKLIGNVEDKHILIIFMLLLLNYNYFIANTMIFSQNFDTSFLTDSNDLKNTNHQCATFEYLPSRVENEYLLNRQEGTIVLSGNPCISNEYKNKSYMQFDVFNNDNDSEIELPYIYYLGYAAKIDDEEIKINESPNGFVSIIIPKDKIGKVTIKYQGTFIYKISILISIFGLGSFIMYVIILRKKEKNK